MTSGVILYGPPAAGKDSITHEITRQDERYQLFPRLKVGPGRTAGYRLASPASLDRLRRDGGVIWENDRYHATYVIDAPELRRRLHDHHPVLHLGQVDGVRRVVASTPETSWLLVYLWCPREIARQRLIDRGSEDISERLDVWDHTASLPEANLTINTAEMTPDQSAARILAHAYAS